MQARDDRRGIGRSETRGPVGEMMEGEQEASKKVCR
jgi:hypothetical protein